MEIWKVIWKIIYYSPLILVGYKTLPDLIQSLGTFYVKLAQIATTRPDIVSEKLIYRLKPLQDHVPFSPGDVRLENLIFSGSIALIYDVGNSESQRDSEFPRRTESDVEITK